MIKLLFFGENWKNNFLIVIMKLESPNFAKHDIKTCDKKHIQKQSSDVFYKKRILKGYLRYKMITSQNVSTEAQVKKFFIL